MHRRFALVVLAGTAALLGSGCSGGDIHHSAHRSAIRPGASDTTSYAEGPAPAVLTQTGPPRAATRLPPRPPAAEAQTADSALAVARYYVEALDYGFRTNDSEPMAAVSDLDSCDACVRDRDEMASDRQSGAHTIGGQITIVAAQLSRSHQSEAASCWVELTISQDAGTIIRPTGAEPIPEQRGVTEMLRLSWRGSRWLVMDVA